MTLTAADAQAMHNDAVARGKWLVWTLTDADVEHRNSYVARAHESEHTGGKLLPGVLVAPTLDELRAMSPAGLTRQGPTSGVVQNLPFLGYTRRAETAGL